ncbi:MAG: acyl-CoA dehydratase activase-related protein, partial [Spirochaetota bacterium]
TLARINTVPDLMKIHNRLLFKDYKPRKVDKAKNIRIGIPRVLEFWASIPYWKALFTSLGFEVVVSKKSTYSLFESGLHSVPSDTVCFPAKLVHGHIIDLVKQKVDRIFFPMMIRIPKENPLAGGTHVCSVVQGYPLVTANSYNTSAKFGIPMDYPTFHWYNRRLKQRQTVEYLTRTLNIPKSKARRAVREAEQALVLYKNEMFAEGKRVLDSVKRDGAFAVVLAGQPYHSDELVNHNLAGHFVRLGIPVLVLDALPELHSLDLSKVRIETTIPFHTRMVAAALYAAKNPDLELVEIVSFGCGHAAVISDEMARLLRDSSGKELLILKVDEGDVWGSLNIRIKSFVETIRIKRERQKKLHKTDLFQELKDAFASKFGKKDKNIKTILAPNLSPAFSTIISSVVCKEGYKVFQMPLADRRAIELGKKYVHNDVCYPAQVNIGEALAMIERGRFLPDEVAVGLAKNCEDCRAGQYAALARKALDEAGYPQIPIVTTGSDTKNMHPGFNFSLRFQINMIWGLSMMDGLEMMRRTIRPYELAKGRADEVFQHYLSTIAQTVACSHSKALTVFKEAVREFNQIPIDTLTRKPRVGVVGEIFLNYHPVSNCNIERYLEENGMEVVIPPMLDFFRRSWVIEKDKAKRKLLPHPYLNALIAGLTDSFIGLIKERVDRVLSGFKFSQKNYNIHELVKNIEGLIDVSYIVGEGWLMPAEIIQMIKEGVKSIVIVQPFGCLPNHITGRGMTKTLKSLFPHVQFLSLDYDPDTSFANIENRLQMLIINARELENPAAAAN